MSIVRCGSRGVVRMQPGGQSARSCSGIRGCYGAALFSLAAPLQRDRPAHGMLHRLATAARIEAGLLEREVPFGGAVGVVNQHEIGVIAQALSLLFHGALVLANEFLSEEAADRQNQRRGPAKNIPRRANINAAMAGSDRGYGGERGKPSIAAAHYLVAEV